MFAAQNSVRLTDVHVVVYCTVRSSYTFIGAPLFEREKLPKGGQTKMAAILVESIQ